jgi:hypothetical protein
MTAIMVTIHASTISPTTRLTNSSRIFFIMSPRTITSNLFGCLAFFF